MAIKPNALDIHIPSAANRHTTTTVRELLQEIPGAEVLSPTADATTSGRHYLIVKKATFDRTRQQVQQLLTDVFRANILPMDPRVPPYVAGQQKPEAPAPTRQPQPAKADFSYIGKLLGSPPSGVATAGHPGFTPDQLHTAHQQSNVVSQASAPNAVTPSTPTYERPTDLTQTAYSSDDDDDDDEMDPDIEIMEINISNHMDMDTDVASHLSTKASSPTPTTTSGLTCDVGSVQLLLSQTLATFEASQARLANTISEAQTKIQHDVTSMKENQEHLSRRVEERIEQQDKDFLASRRATEEGIAAIRADTQQQLKQVQQDNQQLHHSTALLRETQAELSREVTRLTSIMQCSALDIHTKQKASPPVSRRTRLRRGRSEDDCSTESSEISDVPLTSTVSTTPKDTDTIDLAMESSDDGEPLESPSILDEPSITPIPEESAWHEASGGHEPHLDTLLTTYAQRQTNIVERDYQDMREPDVPTPYGVIGLRLRRKQTKTTQQKTALHQRTSPGGPKAQQRISAIPQRGDMGAPNITGFLQTMQSILPIQYMANFANQRSYNISTATKPTNKSRGGGFYSVVDVIGQAVGGVGNAAGPGLPSR